MKAIVTCYKPAAKLWMPSSVYGNSTTKTQVSRSTITNFCILMLPSSITRKQHDLSIFSTFLVLFFFKLLYISLLLFLCVLSPSDVFRHDCGFFMISYIESWDGKTMPHFSQDDIPDTRVHVMSSMLHFACNVSRWQQVLKP